MTSRKTLGVLGGMGSWATADTLRRLVALQSAPTDQDYIEIFIHNNSRVPDRTLAVLGEGPSPLPELRRSTAICNAAGADFLIIPCMSAHHYLEELQAESEAVFIDGIAETVAFIARTMPAIRRVGVLATTGSLQCGFYQRHLANAGLEPVVFAGADQQHYVMDAVYAPWGVKAGNVTGTPRTRLAEAAALLVERGAEAIIGGCTEVQIVLQESDVSVPLIHALDVLCRTAVARCLGRDPT